MSVMGLILTVKPFCKYQTTGKEEHEGVDQMLPVVFHVMTHIFNCSTDTAVNFWFNLQGHFPDVWCINYTLSSTNGTVMENN